MESFGGAPLPARLVIPRSRGFAVRLVLLNLLMLALPVGTYFLDPVKGIIAGVLCVPFFGFTLILHLRGLFSRKPVLELDAMGFTDRTSAVRFGPIAWSEVSDLQPTGAQRQQWVAVLLHDPERVLARGGRGARIAARMNAKLMGAYVTIGARPTQLSAEQLIEVMVAYAQRSVGQPWQGGNGAPGSVNGWVSQ